MFKPLSIFIGLRYTKAKRRNQFISFISLTSLLGLALGVCAMIVVLSVMNGFQREMSSRILSLVSHATITANAPIEHWPDLAQALSADEQVLGVAPYAMLEGMLSYRGTMQPIQVNGIDPAQESNVSTIGEHMQEGALADLKPGEYKVVLGALVAARFGLAVGDKVTLIVPELSDAPGGVTPRMHRLTVGGIFQVGAELDASLGVIHVADAAKMQGYQADHISSLRLKLNNLYDAPVISQRLAQQLGEGFVASDWSHTHGSLFSAMKMEKTMIGLLLMLIVAVAAFNIVATLIMVVSDKGKDIAILRTIGATPAQIMQVFMVQGIIIGVFGTLIGAAVGVLVALNISELLVALEQMGGQQLFNADVYFISSLPSQLQLLDVLLICSVSLSMSFLATLYPSWRASQIQPAEALRYE